MGLLFFIIFAIVGLGLWLRAREKRQIRVQDFAISSIPNFNPEVKYYGLAGGGKGLAIDPISKRFAILNGQGGSKTFRYSELVQIDAVRNGGSMLQTRRGNESGATAGAVGQGWLFSGDTRSQKRKRESVNKLSLKIYTDDVMHPVHEIVFFDGKAKSTDREIEKLGKEIDEWYRRFRTMLAE
ncbi:hypothetical protein NKI09_17620 [Mesorhizobium sp. M0757]|uniref:hypothetical protein n=1 Tax=Mesorhizobium sp. M0757 TaxID=2956993 RepID=UPI00333DE8E8